MISFTLNRGGLTEHVSEVYLFDALYGQVENFTHWLGKYDGRLLNITTPNGGTKENSVELIDDLNDWGVANLKLEANSATPEELRQGKIVTVVTTLGHSEVINPFFELALRSSHLIELNP